MAIKTRKPLGAAFGLNEAGLVDLPVKIGNCRVSRLVFTKATGGCNHCFPHGYESTNSTVGKRRRSWKHRRPAQSRAEAGGRHDRPDFWRARRLRRWFSFQVQTDPATKE